MSDALTDRRGQNDDWHGSGTKWDKSTEFQIDLSKNHQIRPSIIALHECIELQMKKSKAYQNPKSAVKQAHYYQRGVASILETIDSKRLRIKSIMETIEHDSDYTPDFESLEDSFLDLINYASFAVAWLRGGIEGQETKDPFNRV